MKTGILTFANTNNYGAELQAFALLSTVRRLGVDAELIDYRCPQVNATETPGIPSLGSLFEHPKGSLRRLVAQPALRARRAEFERFRRERQALGPRVRSEGEIASRYNTVVVGSDQVWNLEITGGDMTFFLDDPAASSLRKVAYAASFGRPFVPTERKAEVARALGAFDALGVREDDGAELAGRLSGRSARVVVDPTPLLEGEEWAQLASPRLVGEKYVFAYVVTDRERTLRFAREAARKLGARLVVVECYGPRPSLLHKSLSGSSPEDFLSLVRHAQLVVTSSFHGLALSLALGSDVRFVLSEDAHNRNSRILTLARLAGVERRSVDVAEAAPMEWGRVRAALSAARAESLRFLAEALGVTLT